MYPNPRSASAFHLTIVSSSLRKHALNILIMEGDEPDVTNSEVDFFVFTDEFDQEHSRVHLLTPSSHNDTHLNFWAFLGLCDKYNVDLLPIVWHTGLDAVGLGGQGQIHESFQHRAFGFAFKRWKLSNFFRQLQQTNAPYQDSQLIQEFKGMYRAFTAELHALMHPGLKMCPYIIKLEGVGWERILPELYIPVLVFERCPQGSLKDFMLSDQGRKTTLDTRIRICQKIALGLYCLHVNGTAIPTNPRQPLIRCRYRAWGRESG